MPKPPPRGEAETLVQPRATSSARTTRASAAGTKSTLRDETSIVAKSKKPPAEGLTPCSLFWSCTGEPRCLRTAALIPREDSCGLTWKITGVLGELDGSRRAEGIGNMVATCWYSAAVRLHVTTNNLGAHARLPADLVLLRTDQLDGETDWKLSVAVPATQNLPSDQELLNPDAEIYADAPTKDTDSFISTFIINVPSRVSSNEVSMVQLPTVNPLSAEDLWANTALAEGSAIEFVHYTGLEARAAMNTSHPETKVGLLDLEISQLAKIVVYLGVPLPDFILVNCPYQSMGQPGHGQDGVRSSCDKEMSILGTIMRTSTLPGKLGQMEYLLSDKRDTLTQNGVVWV